MKSKSLFLVILAAVALGTFVGCEHERRTTTTTTTEEAVVPAATTETRSVRTY